MFVPVLRVLMLHLLLKLICCALVDSGAGELPQRLVLSCVCAGMVPVAPAVGAVLAYLRLAHWWHAV